MVGYFEQREIKKKQKIQFKEDIYFRFIEENEYLKPCWEGV